MHDEQLRRLIDALVALAGIVLLSPLLAIIALLIKADSPGPVLYGATRVGRGGKHFTLYKFRSMSNGADARGPRLTIRNDPRITRIGNLLRATKLDELPQLLNVLTGDMSLVGPRPEDPRYVSSYTAAQRAILRVRPGITSVASLTYRNESLELTSDRGEAYYLQSILPVKLAMDLDYLDRRTLASDAIIIVKTVRALLHF